MRDLDYTEVERGEGIEDAKWERLEVLLNRSMKERKIGKENGRKLGMKREERSGRMKKVKIREKSVHKGPISRSIPALSNIRSKAN